MKFNSLCALTILLVVATSAAFGADWDQKTVGETMEKAKSGKRVELRRTYPEDQVYLTYFEVTRSMAYIIDAKARLCYLRWEITASTGAVTLVPCKSLKDGYPIMAPIIDWEK